MTDKPFSVPNQEGGERVRVILDCDWSDLQHALDMVIDAKPSFDRQKNDRPGWGWHWSRRGKPALFVRRTKNGYSATADRVKQSPTPSQPITHTEGEG